MRIAIVAAVLTSTGCGGRPEPTPTDEPDVAAVWTDRVCGSVLPFATAATAAPDFATATDLDTVQRIYSDYLAGLIGGVRDGRAALAAAGPAPVAAGDAVLDRLRLALTRLEQDVTGARATVDAANPRAPSDFVASVGRVESTVTSMTVPDVVGELESVSELAAATRTAPQCRKVRKLAAAAPR